MNAFVTARRGGLAWLLGLVMVGVPALARADVWGYVDARGVAHLAATMTRKRQTPQAARNRDGDTEFPRGETNPAGAQANNLRQVAAGAAAPGRRAHASRL